MNDAAKRKTAISAGAAFLIFVVIALATGGGIGFAIIGGLICAVVAVLISAVVRQAKAASRQ